MSRMMRKEKTQGQIDKRGKADDGEMKQQIDETGAG